MEKFKFAPEVGFRDKASFPDPATEEILRDMFQRIPDQLKDYLNGAVYNEFNDLPNRFSNPNLLINSDFRNPINQRGKTSYWKPSSWTYNIDRFSHILNSVILNGGYIRIYNDTGETGTTFFKQIFEHPLEQNDYTVTVNVKEITGTVQVNGFGTLKKGINVFTVKNTSLSQLQLNLVGESSIELYYIKLEQGSIATPFVPRHYGEELALCQRYYLKLFNESTFFRACVVNNNNQSWSFADIVLPCEMRINPTVSVVTAYTPSLNNANYSSLATVEPLSNSTLRVRGETPNDCVFCLKGVSLDAEIY